MDVTSTQQGSILVIAVSGSMDALTAPALSEYVTQHIATGQVNLVVDMAELEYTSSAGLRALLSGVKEARQHAGDLRLASVRPNVRKVLEMSGFTSIMKVFPNVAEAVQSYA
jgi:anti-sigma B factor antagonist